MPAPRATRSKPSQVAWRRRIASLLNHLFDKRASDRSAFAGAIQMSVGQVLHWSSEKQADSKTLPAYAIVHLPKDIRDEVLRTLGEWGDQLERGEL